MRRPCIASFRGRSMSAFSVVILGILILSACRPGHIPVSKQASAQRHASHSVRFLRSFHSELLDASGREVHLTGINWFGFETGTFVPHGLWARNWQDMLKQIAQTGFNTIRLPFTNQLFDPGNQPNSINYQLNPDLKGLRGLALMDRIIQGAHNVGLKIILDRHDPTADLRPPMWYTNQMSQTNWINDWTMLAQHYRGNDTIMGLTWPTSRTPRPPGVMATQAPIGAWRPSRRATPSWPSIRSG